MGRIPQPQASIGKHTPTDKSPWEDAIMPKPPNIGGSSKPQQVLYKPHITTPHAPKIEEWFLQSLEAGDVKGTVNKVWVEIEKDLRIWLKGKNMLDEVFWNNWSGIAY